MKVIHDHVSQRHHPWAMSSFHPKLDLALAFSIANQMSNNPNAKSMHVGIAFDAGYWHVVCSAFDGGGDVFRVSPTTEICDEYVWLHLRFTYQTQIDELISVCLRSVEGSQVYATVEGS